MYNAAEIYSTFLSMLLVISVAEHHRSGIFEYEIAFATIFF